MAAKSFLDKDSVSEFQLFFRAAFEEMRRIGGNWSWLNKKLSAHLGAYLTAKLRALPSQPHVQVVKLGSWSRGELCPRSDIDVLLLGAEKDVLAFVNEAAEAGISLQYRVPLNDEDWLDGVAEFDHLALMYAESLKGEECSSLEKQKKLAWERAHGLKKTIAELMHAERGRRNKRYDSLANYLEPNLKYGPGALRDLQQALVTVSFYPNVFKNYKKEIAYLENIKSFLLVLRHSLHLNDQGDIFVASSQKNMAQALGFSSRLEFTSKLQKNLSEINFYCQWIFEIIGTNPIKVEHIKSKRVDSLGAAIDLIMHDHSLVVLEKIREIIKRLELDRQALAKVKETLGSDLPEEKFIAFFQSGVLYKVFHHLGRVKGLVQYDHYHRYTVDAHTLQALRFFCKSKADPAKHLRLNSEWVKDFNKNDWDILLWALLYHDMAKGLPGSHSELGAQIASEELSAMGFAPGFYQEVSWLIKNHLALSEAAFRKNPEDPSTWQWLTDKGSNPKRLKTLAALTAIDIMATNIEAWTPWKSDLLHRLVTQVLSPQVENFVQLSEELENVASSDVVESFLSDLEPTLSNTIPNFVLKKDFADLLEKQGVDLPVLVWQQDPDHSWVRFHSARDAKGLFLGWSRLLFATGCLVREAYIHTFSCFGAYDWFMINTRKSADVLSKQLSSLSTVNGEIKKVYFDSIHLINTPTDGHWIIRFKGMDQQGALVEAVRALFDHGLEVQWARVHTWGNILEDIFAVSIDKNIDVDLLLKSLREKHCQ